MSYYFQTAAIPLKRMISGDYNRLYDFYTLAKGKITAQGVGVLKMQSRLAGFLEPFAVIHLDVVSGFKKKTITGAVTIQRYTRILDDLDRIRTAVTALHLTSRLMKEGDGSQEIFYLLRDFLAFLNNTSSFPREIASAFYTIKFLSLLGYKPMLDSCVSCRFPYSERRRFFLSPEGGVVCELCRKVKQGATLHGELFVFLQKSLREPFFSLSQYSLSPEYIQQLNNFVSQFLHYHTG